MFEKVLSYFREIASIPHGSGNTDMLCDYCVNFALSHNLRYIKDLSGNIVIFKNGTHGYETSPEVILQGHLDMVCVKEESSSIDFLKQGLKLCEDEEYIWADGTSLGGDDSIAIAYALAILDSDNIAHPPLEVIFTTDEETGMFGAEGLDMTPLKSKMLINIDSEEEGTLLVSCAGGVRCDGKIPVKSVNENKKGLKLTLSGLKGGHSGTEIHKAHLNAIITLCSLLLDVKHFSLSSIKGGSADNAIPTFCEATLFTEDKDTFIKCVTEKFNEIKECHKNSEPDMTLSITDEDISNIISEKDSRKIVKAVSGVPNGVIAFSENIEGLVETSLNLGLISREEDNILVGHALRSSVSASKEKLKESLSKHYEASNADLDFHSDYPGWEYKENSVLQKVFKICHKELFGKELNVSAIHAGLECGIFLKKAPYLDCVSFGPDIFDIHSTNEKLSKASAKRSFELLVSVLRCLS